MKLIMNKILKITTVFLTFFFVLSSCDKDENEITIPNDNYYVNYIIKAPGPYGRFSNWTVTTPDGTYSNNGYQVSSWNQTYGPVKKGFNCKVQIGKFQGGTPTIEIHVSKNQEPFALKTIKTGDLASYTINF